MESLLRSRGMLTCGQEELDQVSRASSRYSLFSGMLPSLGARSNRRVQLKAFIVSPYDRRYRIWQAFLVILVIYTAWASPFEFGYLDKPEVPLSIIDNVVNGFFAIDIVLTFFVAYLDKTTYLLVDDQKKIAWRYARTWLVFDVISTIPSELARKIPAQPFQSYGLFVMLRLWRLRRVSAMFARLEKDQNFNYFWVRFTKLAFVCLFTIHCAGCFFFHIASHYFDPKRTWIGEVIGGDFHERSVGTQYVISVYWSTTTITTTGYGDFHPMNTREIGFAVSYVLFNLSIMAYLVGNMTNLVVHRTKRTRHFRDTIQTASNFAQRNHLPPQLQDQMLDHLCLKYRTNAEGLQRQESLDSLPKAVRSSISHYLFYSVVDKVYLFDGVSNDMIFQLVSEMKAEYFPPKADVILQNEAPTDFYVLVSGAVELLVSKDGVEQVVAEAKSGDVCGEIGVLCYKPQPFTVRTKSLCQLLRIDRATFLNIIQSNVGDGTLIVNNLLQHLKGLKDPAVEGVCLGVENMLALGRTDLPLNLCFAALRGDDTMLHQLLKKGLNPNEPDNNGRTPLHIAASRGSENCVLLLLDFGADPNSRDSEGNVPLWEAMVAGNERVVGVLRDNGADINAGDVGHFACIAAEQNNLELVEEILRYGGDITRPRSNGSTALHVAVCEENVEVLKFLLDHGADVEKPDMHGWTPKDLAEQQGHEDIKAIFQSIGDSKPQSSVPAPEERQQQAGVRFPRRLTSEPNIRPAASRQNLPLATDGSWSHTRQRRKINNFQNSFFGMLAPFTGQEDSVILDDKALDVGNSVRVTISCLEKGEVKSKLVLLPGSIQELLELGAQKFGINPVKILSKDDAEIDDINVIRDLDHLILRDVNAEEPVRKG